MFNKNTTLGWDGMNLLTTLSSHSWGSFFSSFGLRHVCQQLIGPGAGAKLTHLIKYLMKIMKSCENALKVY